MSDVLKGLLIMGVCFGLGLGIARGVDLALLPQCEAPDGIGQVDYWPPVEVDDDGGVEC